MLDSTLTPFEPHLVPLVISLVAHLWRVSVLPHRRRQYRDGSGTYPPRRREGRLGTPAIIVLTRFIPDHTARQGLGRYTVYKHRLQDKRSIGAMPQVWCRVGGRADLPAEGRPSIRVCSHSHLALNGWAWSRVAILRMCRALYTHRRACGEKHSQYTQMPVRSRRRLRGPHVVCLTLHRSRLAVKTLTGRRDSPGSITSGPLDFAQLPMGARDRDRDRGSRSRRERVWQRGESKSIIRLTSVSCVHESICIEIESWHGRLRNEHHKER